MALGVLWLIVGLTVLALFVPRLWSALPPDPEYRRRVARWLAALAVAGLCYNAWLIHSRSHSRSADAARRSAPP